MNDLSTPCPGLPADGQGRGIAKNKSGRDWNNQEIEVLRTHYKSKGTVGCATLLPGRSQGSIRMKAFKLGLSFVGFPHTWSAKELELLEARYPGEGPTGCLSFLPGRSRGAIVHKAAELELRMDSLEPLEVISARRFVEKHLASVAAQREWTTVEVAKLKQYYSSKGCRGCLPLLPGRTVDAIRTKASSLGLQTVRTSVARRIHIATDEIDQAIRSTYANTKNRKNGFLLKLSARTDRPQWWLQRRAAALGLTIGRIKEPNWTPDEDRLVSAWVRDGWGIGKIKAGLKCAGHARSAGAIRERIRGLELKFDRDPETTGYYNMDQASQLMGVARSTIDRWIDKYGLPAKKNGHWRIRRDRLRQWIRDNPIHIDLSKVDKYWFIGLMGGE